MGDLKWLRSSFVWIILIVAVIALWFIVRQQTTIDRQTKTVRRQSWREIQSGEVANAQPDAKAADRSRSNTSKRRQERRRRRSCRRGSTLLEMLDRLRHQPADPRFRDLNIESKPASRWGGWLSALTFLLPTLF